MSKPIIIVQGAQYGSEAKGAIAGYLCRTRHVNFAVRTGASNAGHSVMYRGKKVVCQTLPVGFVNDNTTLIIGAGALIDPDLLDREVNMLSEVTGSDITDRLFIDGRAGVHQRAHAELSASSDRHHLMGATGKGCSEALISRISNRGKGGILFRDTAQSVRYRLADTEEILNRAYDIGAQILLEGTQGTLLDLYLGPYPYVTHKQTGPGQWMLEAGLSPALQTEIVSVVRTYPIRVAGNSGPLPQETSWPIFARLLNAKRAVAGLPGLVRDESIEAFEMSLKVAIRSGEFEVPALTDNGLDQHTWQDRYRYRVALSELNTVAWKALPAPVQADLSTLFELTTVTKKLRRIAPFDEGDLVRSARQSRPHWVALTFMNHLMPEYWYATNADANAFLHPSVGRVEAASNAPVRLLTFGPGDEHVVSR